LANDAKLPTAARLPTAVVFDMDGVLVDTEPVHGRCFVEAFGRLGIQTTLEYYRGAVSLGGSPVRDLYLSLGGRASDWEEVKRIKDGLMEKAMRDEVEAMPGIERLLAELRLGSVRTALATSARRRSMEIVLDAMSLWDYFDVFVTKEEVKEEKPSPEAFLIAVQRLQAEPWQCVVVEDSPRGVAAAHRAGIRSVAVPNKSTEDGDFSEATLIVESVEDISLNTLQSLFA